MFSSQNYMQTYTSDQIKIHHGRIRIDEYIKDYDNAEKI